MKATSSPPKTAALKMRAVTKVLVVALAALLMSDEDDDVDDDDLWAGEQAGNQGVSEGTDAHRSGGGGQGAAGKGLWSLLEAAHARTSVIGQ